MRTGDVESNRLPPLARTFPEDVKKPSMTIRESESLGKTEETMMEQEYIHHAYGKNFKLDDNKAKTRHLDWVPGILDAAPISGNNRASPLRKAFWKADWLRRILRQYGAHWTQDEHLDDCVRILMRACGLNMSQAVQECRHIIRENRALEWGSRGAISIIIINMVSGLH